ncbi:MAG: RNA polymerase sigma factor [Polyangia bacterium]
MTETETAAAFERYGALVLRRCRRILRNEAAAEDVLQEVFVRVMRHGSAFTAADSKLAWLYRVADNCCFDQLRRQRHSPPEPEPTTSQPALEDRDVVLRFLGRFDERVQRVAVLHYLDGMTQDEIARATGWSRQTVFNKLSFIRERAEALKKSLFGGGS